MPTLEGFWKPGVRKGATAPIQMGHALTIYAYDVHMEFGVLRKRSRPSAYFFLIFLHIVPCLAFCVLYLATIIMMMAHLFFEGMLTIDLGDYPAPTTF